MPPTPGTKTISLSSPADSLLASGVSACREWRSARPVTPLGRPLDMPLRRLGCELVAVLGHGRVGDAMDASLGA